MNIPAKGFSLFQIDVPDSECLETFRPVDPSSFTKRNVSRMLIGSLHFLAFGRTGLSMAEQGQTGRAGATGEGQPPPPPSRQPGPFKQNLQERTFGDKMPLYVHT